jgi:hypothetical protein
MKPLCLARSKKILLKDEIKTCIFRFHSKLSETMKPIARTTSKFILGLFMISILFASCKKDNSKFESYFYLSKAITESTATLDIDGTKYGSIQYVATPVTAQSAGTTHVTLPSGRHNISVYAGGKCIISCYATFQCDGLGTGSWGPGGGGSECQGDPTTSNNVFIGLSE